MSLLRFASVLTLAALVLMAWSLFVPTVLPVILAMSAGQALGTIALATYIIAVAADRRSQRKRSGGEGAAG
jgi:hypothetical protein